MRSSSPYEPEDYDPAGCRMGCAILIAALAVDVVLVWFLFRVVALWWF